MFCRKPEPAQADEQHGLPILILESCDNKQWTVLQRAGHDAEASGAVVRGALDRNQNDVPMAAKAHIIGTAFLGVDIKCARCHDAHITKP